MAIRNNSKTDGGTTMERKHEGVTTALLLPSTTLQKPPSVAIINRPGKSNSSVRGRPSITDQSTRQRIKIWTICLCICAGGGIPFFCTLYIPNTAQESMQTFLYESLFAEQHQKHTDDISHSSLQQMNNQSFNHSSISKEDKMSLSILWSVFISEMAMGQFFGYLIASPVIDRLGRKRSIIFCNLMQVPFQLCHILAQPLNAWPLLYVARGGCMLVFAVSSVAVPTFLNEISPVKTRGSLGTSYPLSLSFGALMGGVLGMDRVLGSKSLWPLAFIVPLSFSLIIVPVIILLPESPTYLASQYKYPESKRSLTYYHGNDNEFDSVVTESHSSDTLLRNNKLDDGKSKENKRTSGSKAMVQLLRKRSLRGPTILTFVISLTFVCSGISVVSAYSTAIIFDSGLTWATAEYCTVALKLLSFSTYILCLFSVDKIGRRILMLTSVGGSGLSWTLLVLCIWLPSPYKAVISTGLIFSAQFFMNVGIRPLFYVLVPELFPFRYRTAGKSLAALLGVLMVLPVLFCFWPLLQIMGNWAFLCHSLPLWFCFFYLWRNLPETKGRRSDEVFQELRIAGSQHHHNQHHLHWKRHHSWHGEDCSNLNCIDPRHNHRHASGPSVAVEGRGDRVSSRQPSFTTSALRLHSAINEAHGTTVIPYNTGLITKPPIAGISLSQQDLSTALKK